MKDHAFWWNLVEGGWEAHISVIQNLDSLEFSILPNNFAFCHLVVISGTSSKILLQELPWPSSG